jgi:hypothetical protein
VLTELGLRQGRRSRLLAEEDRLVEVEPQPPLNRGREILSEIRDGDGEGRLLELPRYPARP